MGRGVSEAGGRHNDIEATAAAWVIRLGGDPLTPDERQTLDRWLAAHPDHPAAFDYARSTWGDLAALRGAPGTLADDVVPPPLGASHVARLHTRSRPRLWARAGALAAAILLALGLGVTWLGDPVTLLIADYRTAPAETRTVILPDRSEVELGPDSAVALRFDGRERRIELLAGAIHVAAAPMNGDEGRPFVVEAADGAAKALGTRFLVDRMADAVQVTVTEHRVAVALLPASDPADGVILAPGQTVRYDRSAGLGAVLNVNLDYATAWRRGRLVFDRVPLAEVVAALNRYRRGRIVIADAALGERTVSGVFETARLDEALASIARELGVRTAAVPPFVTLLY